MALQVRPIVDGELEAFVRADSLAFGFAPRPQGVEEVRAELDVGRSRAVFEGDRLVAASGTIAFELTLPGLTTIGAAGISWVGVLPTHRRRGALRLMMGALLDDVARRGEAVAILTSSESQLYGRFGFGPGTWRHAWEIDRHHAVLPAALGSAGSLELVEGDEARAQLPPLFDRARRRQPGDIDRSARWWATHLRPPEPPPPGSARFHVVHHGSSGPDGYASYRMEGRWEHGLPEDRLVVDEVAAAEPAVEAALWRYVFSMDLVGVVIACNRPVDEPLRWMLTDPRRLRVTMVKDELWVRLVDVPAALAARRYGVDGELVLEVVGAGRYRLAGGPGAAECGPAGAGTAPELALGLADLGAIYLGGVAPSTLAAAGRVVEERPGALLRADAMFASQPAPFLRTGF